MSKHLFDGTGVALVTPFDKKGKVDVTSLQKITNHVIKGGVDYIVILGTTGESVTLNSDEKKLVINTIRNTADGKCKLVLGVGGNNTLEVVNTIKTTDFTDISAILSVSPYYNKPGQRGIIEHYKAIEKVAPVPIIIYNVPGRTGQSITPETTILLANYSKQFIATKEASGNIEGIMQIIKNAPKHFAIISGDDPITVPLIAVGARGVISVSANMYPKHVSEMVNAALKNNFAKANELHYKLLDPTYTMFAEGNPAGVKEFMAQIKLCTNAVRLPLLSVTKGLSATVKKQIKDLK